MSRHKERENRFMNIEERIEELLSKMTLHEKVGQLHQVAPSKVGGFEIPEEEAFKLYKSGDMDEKTYDAIINHKMLSNHEDEIRKGEIGSFIVSWMQKQRTIIKKLRWRRAGWEYL